MKYYEIMKRETKNYNKNRHLNVSKDIFLK